MQKDMDTIIFESRTEIDDVIRALETFAKEHPAQETESIKQLVDLLDAMYMSW